MSLRWRRSRVEKPKATVDMTSLIDLTFLLLVTFIVTLPVLEQGVPVVLPQMQADPLPVKDKKANVVTVNEQNEIFLNNEPKSSDELARELRSLVEQDPGVPVHVRGDMSLEYGKVMAVIKIVKDSGVTKMALATEGK